MSMSPAKFAHCASGTIALLALGLFSVAPARAGAPMAKTNAPAFYRIMLGNFEVTVLSDGTGELPVKELLQGLPAPQIDWALDKAYVKDPVETSFNQFLINTGTKLVLIDTGAGSFFGPTLGNLAANLKASGYKPAQIDEIYITHMHPDHIGGLVVGGKPAFPNAIVRADQHESDYFLSQSNLDQAPSAAKDFFKNAQAALGPYVSAGKYKPFNGATDLLPGISAFASPGHTPGHTGYLVQSQGQKLMVIGDVVHVLAVQFHDPQVTLAFDTDSKAAQAERMREFTDIATQGTLVGAAHLPFPGLGHIRGERKRFEWMPVNYTQIH